MYVILTACASFEGAIYYFKQFDEFLEFMIIYNICLSLVGGPINRFYI